MKHKKLSSAKMKKEKQNNANSNNKLSLIHLNKKQKNERQENSLDELTKEFIDYVLKSTSKDIYINDLVKKLKVKKRRIYDITNVLEGKILNIIFIFSYFFHKVRYRIYKKRS